jgi:hypothetical protein
MCDEFFLFCHIYVMDFSFLSFSFLSYCSMLDFSVMFIIYGIFHFMDFSFYLRSIYQEEDFKAFVDCDKEAECFGNLTDVEICDAVKLNRQGMADLEEEDVEEEAGIVDKPMPGVSHKDALMGLSLVRSYLEEILQITIHFMISKT